MYTAPSYPKLRPLDAIEIHCNIAEPAILNHSFKPHSHEEADIIYTFFPEVIYGGKISEKVSHVIFVPIKNHIEKKIDVIIIHITDENGNLINTTSSNK